MQQPDWTLYQAFLAVIESGNLTRAAKALGMSQPTLSRQIMALEQALGTTLFERGGRGLKPSQTAQRIAVQARAMKHAASGIQLTASTQSLAVSGTVRVTASEVIAAYALPDVLARLSIDYPNIQIELDANNDVTNLLDREADIAVRMTRPKQSGLIAKRLPDVHTGFYASKDYVARHGIPSTLQDLLKLRLVGYDRSTLILNAARKAKIPVARDSFGLRCDHQIACWHMVRAGLGVGIIARFVGDRDDGVVRVLPKFSLTPMQMWIVAHREVKDAARVRAVYDAIADGLPAKIET